MTTAMKVTPKQQQVLKLLRQGRTPSEVAKRLNTSSSNIHGHIRRMREAGVEIPSSNGASASNGSGPSASAGREVPAEDRARQALMELLEGSKARAVEIDERCGEMAEEVERLKAERDLLTDRSAHYAKALDELSA